MIAVSFALPAESSLFLRRLRDPSSSLAGKDVVVLHTGVGKIAAQNRIAEFLRMQSPTQLISAGFVGALNDELRVGDLLLAENFSDCELRLAAERVLDLRIGRLITTDAIIDSLGEREALTRETGAIAVDMETEFLAEACAAARVPMLSLRVVTDTPKQPLPAPPQVLFNLAKQKTEPLTLMRYLARHPSSIPRLIAFGHRISSARRGLTTALEVLLRDSFD